jgi:hypothetical protein
VSSIFAGVPLPAMRTSPPLLQLLLNLPPEVRQTVKTLFAVR